MQFVFIVILALIIIIIVIETYLYNIAASVFKKKTAINAGPVKNDKSKSKKDLKIWIKIKLQYYKIVTLNGRFEQL